MSLRPKTYAEALARKQAADARSKARRASQPRPKAVRKASGQAELFKSIAASEKSDNPHAPWTCVVCEKPLFELGAANFSHLLPKGTYPRWKLLRKNIVIKCSGCHRKWHNAGREALCRNEHGNGSNWNFLFGLFDWYKAEYHRTNKATR